AHRSQIASQTHAITDERWDLTSLPPSSEKLRLREPGPDAPRVTRSGDHMPRVLFSAPECRAVVLDLETGETMGDHQVRERAVVQVVRDRVLIESGGRQSGSRRAPSS